MGVWFKSNSNLFFSRAVKSTVVLLSTGLAIACQPRVENEPPPCPAPPTNQFKIDNQSLSFVDDQAQWTDPTLSGRSATTQYKIVKQLDEDIDQDGTPDELAVILSSPAGSGSFYYLAANLRQSCTSTPLNSVFLGDRISINGLRVQNQAGHVDEGMIYVDIGIRAEDQAMAEPPRLQVSRMYRLAEGQLVDVPQY